MFILLLNSNYNIIFIIFVNNIFILTYCIIYYIIKDNYN